MVRIEQAQINKKEWLRFNEKRRHVIWREYIAIERPNVKRDLKSHGLLISADWFLTVKHMDSQVVQYDFAILK
jgi:hypothetical protein